MKTSELAKQLGVPVKRIDEWCRAGMPSHGPKSKRKRQFDVREVCQWLLENGHAVSDGGTTPPSGQAPDPPPPEKTAPAETPPPDKPPDPPEEEPPVQEEGEGLILRTRAEVAKYFDVHLRTVADWLTDPTFPGESGDRGQRNGRFPVMKIFLWLSKNQRKAVADTDPTKQKLAEVKLAAAEHKLRRERGEVISLDDAIALVTRAQSIALNRMMSLPDMLVELLPPDMDQRLKDDYHERATEEVRKAAQSIGRALMEEDDE